MIKSFVVFARGQQTVVLLQEGPISGSLAVAPSRDQLFDQVRIDVVTDDSRTLSAARAIVKGLLGISWRYESNAMDFRLEHAERIEDDICTVSCAQGESKTGMHPCVTCKVDDVTITLCC